MVRLGEWVGVIVAVAVLVLIPGPALIIAAKQESLFDEDPEEDPEEL